MIDDPKWYRGTDRLPTREEVAKWKAVDLGCTPGVMRVTWDPNWRPATWRERLWWWRARLRAWWAGLWR